MDEKFCVLIPAYKPCEGLIQLVNEIRRETSCHIIIVDDGSGKEFNHIFDDVRGVENCHVISYAVNGGKGHALKKGFNLYLKRYGGCPEFTGVVTADADGQHVLKDILRIGNELSSNQDKLIMGVRTFKEGVPLRSKFGNNMTIFVYRLASGMKISDTQTGLRGVPAGLIQKMTELEGDRYEYEMTMLLELKNMGLGVKEVPIETVYIDNNIGSHFKTFSDSYRVYRLIFKKTYVPKYILSSAVSYLMDYIIYSFVLILGLFNLKRAHTAAQIVARVISSIFNFIINKKFVFNNENKSLRSYLYQGISYYALAAFNLFIISIPINDLLIGWGMNKYISQPIANIIQFIISFTVQKYIIFRKTKSISK